MNEDNRTPERLRAHFEVERELAERLRKSTRQERIHLYKTLYEELFARVPDHPRLTRRETAESLAKAVSARMSLLKWHLQGVERFVEFAPGDCRLAFEMCKYASEVIGVDISDQSGETASAPPNFKLIVYDGYELNLPQNSVDLAFSYQFLEHIHPDDVELHLKTAYKILKKGADYIISTPHKFSGPHDISRYFSDVPLGFHLKEWTYRELEEVARRVGFSGVYIFRFGKPRYGWGWNFLNKVVEKIVGILPRKIRKAISARLFPSVNVILRK